MTGNNPTTGWWKGVGLAVLALLLLSRGASAAIAIDNRTATTVNTGNSSTAFTNNAISPMFVALSWQSGTVTSVTWNTSETLTNLLTKADGTAVQFTALYAIKNPSTGTHNIDIVVAGNGGYAAWIIGTTGGDTTTGWRTVYSRNDGDGTGPGLTAVDSQNGDIVFHAVNVTAATVTFDGGETTTSTTTNNIAGNGLSGGLSTKPAVGASTVVGAIDTTFYAEIAVSAIGAGGGAPACGGLGLLGAGCDEF